MQNMKINMPETEKCLNTSKTGS